MSSLRKLFYKSCLSLFEEEKNRLSRCDYFGEVGIVQGQKRSAGTQAACDCDLILIPADKYTMCFSHSATASLDKEYDRVAYKDNELLPRHIRITKACMFIDVIFLLSSQTSQHQYVIVLVFLV